MEIIEKLRQKKWKKDQILILFLAGVLLLVIALPVREPEEKGEGQGAQNTQISSSGDRDYAGYLEGRLEEVLSQMAGAGDVTAMVTLASSGERAGPGPPEAPPAPRPPFMQSQRDRGSSPM